MRKHRLAALLALVIGLLTVVEGGMVLLGLETKPYPVLPWLLRYNVAMGFVSLAAGHGLWRQQRWAETLSRIIRNCHGAVFLLLAVMDLLGMTVAMNSIGAMLFRTAIWTGILMLMKSKSRGAKREDIDHAKQ
jgi:uncharacterized membrane protein (DUF2068 family)